MLSYIPVEIYKNLPKKHLYFNNLFNKTKIQMLSITSEHKIIPAAKKFLFQTSGFTRD